jgi:carboxymethylenebutenolidase
MCHSSDSRPPAPPAPGEVREQGPASLTSADGSPLLAHVARPAEPSRGRVVILPDIRGLHPYYRDLAVRFAEAGFEAIAIDWFGRTAGSAERDDDFEWQPHIAQVDPANVASDVATAAEHLASLGAGGPVFTVGFCFGGSQSWRLSASDLELAGVIGFYGQPQRVRDVVSDMHVPLLLLVAGADMTPQEEFVAFDAELTAAGVPHETHTYAGAPHSFFDRAFADWAEVCDDAWRRILDFTAERSPAG